MRLPLRSDDRELVDEHPSSITSGRADEHNVLVKGQHKRDLVQTGDGEELFVRQDILPSIS